MGKHCANVFGAAVVSGAVALLFATVSAASATPTTGGGFPLSRSTVSGGAVGDRHGGWIAYSTAPVGDVYHNTSNPKPGADVFVIQKRDRPELVAGRGSHHEIWNVCP